jgi:hypothetical protein
MFAGLHPYALAISRMLVPWYPFFQKRILASASIFVFLIWFFPVFFWTKLHTENIYINEWPLIFVMLSINEKKMSRKKIFLEEIYRYDKEEATRRDNPRKGTRYLPTKNTRPSRAIQSKNENFANRNFLSKS